MSSKSATTAAAPPQQPARTDVCELCARGATSLTRHHLIPRTRHKSRRAKRRFERAEMAHRILWVCRPCHSQIHAALSEKELERYYNTRERLLENEVIARFVAWIRDKPADFKPRSSPKRR